MNCVLCDGPDPTEQYLGGEWHEGCLIGLPAVAANHVVHLRKQLLAASDPADTTERDALLQACDELTAQRDQASARADAAEAAAAQLQAEPLAEVQGLRAEIDQQRARIATLEDAAQSALLVKKLPAAAADILQPVVPIAGELPS